MQPEAMERVDVAPVSTGLNLPFARIAEGVRAGGQPAVLGARQPLAPLLPSGLPAARHCPPLPHAAAELPRGADPRSPQEHGVTKRR